MRPELLKPDFSGALLGKVIRKGILGVVAGEVTLDHHHLDDRRAPVFDTHHFGYA